ncbi:CD99 antigen-like protein 2 isoform X2 [Oncorhynchus tshawytscha]|uniref:CD99 antigen-like protein 2 isoform X2 n=1 Tax=Oncorhynchus tshawytscha TaxID=74940 RepID=UPI001C3E856B|nr:CD99 antigen-like protein 2 isoform X2 [Oncorhynchus tshawytscha]
MKKCSAWSLFLVVSLLTVKALSQNSDGFDLSDALDDVSIATATPKPVEGAGADEEITPTKAPPKAPATKAPSHKPKPHEFQADFDFGPSLRPVLLPLATKGPHTPPKPQPASDEFDLSDALDPNNDIGGKDKNKGQADKGIGGGGRGDRAPNNRGGNGGGSFSDDDLLDVGKDDPYNPDKGKGGHGGQSAADDNNLDTMAETGTIAGIISAIGLALVGAVTSYVSYQKKKLCFSIQQSLNADLVKTDNPDAVVATEPQVQQTLLEPPTLSLLVRITLSNIPPVRPASSPNAEPPSQDNTV